MVAPMMPVIVPKAVQFRFAACLDLNETGEIRALNTIGQKWHTTQIEAPGRLLTPRMS